MRRSLVFVPFLSLFKREVKRFFKVIFQTVVSPLISSALYLLIFGVSLDISVGDTPYLAFLIPGLVMMGCLTNSFQNSSSSIVSSKFTGELQDYKIAPLSDQQIVWAMAFGGVIRGFIVGGVTFMVGQIFHYNIHGAFLGVEHPLLLIIFLLIGGLSFAKIGLSIAVWSKTLDHLSAFSSFILTPLIYLGGVFYTLEKLPIFWQKISLFNPLLYFINGVRYSILGASDVSITISICISLVSLVMFHFLACWCVRKGSFGRW